jgi:hypothetical protein
MLNFYTKAVCIVEKKSLLCASFRRSTQTEKKKTGYSQGSFRFPVVRLLLHLWDEMRKRARKGSDLLHVGPRISLQTKESGAMQPYV